MQKSDNVQTIKIRRQAQPSTTLNRKYVKRPEAKNESSVAVNFAATKTPAAAPARKIQIRSDRIEDAKPAQNNIANTSSATPAAVSPAITRFGIPAAKKVTAPKATAVKTPVAKSAAPKITKPKAAAPKAVTKPAAKATEMTPEQLKELAIKKALRSAAKEEPEQHPHKIHFGLGRIFVAFACTAAAIFALIYFVNLNVFNLSVANAAKEAGLETTNTPKVPSGFELSDIASESGKLTLTYTNTSTKTTFLIIEERSSWDSNALLANYVKPTFGDDYTIVREQGLTIYINDSNAAWVNGRTVYKVTTTSGAITKKQIRTIAASL